MPVLPDDGSRIVCPGRSRPCFSACSMIPRAMRSLTEPNGFWLSSFATIRTFGLGESTLTSIIGVLPISSSTLLNGIIARSGRPWQGADHSRSTRSGIVAVAPSRPAGSGRRGQPSAGGDLLLGDHTVDDAVAARLGRLAFE